MQSQILGGDSISTLTATLSIVMHVSTGADVSSASSIDQSAMYSGRGRGRGHGGGATFRGGGSFGARDNVPGGQLNLSDKGPRHCTHYDQNNHIFEKCWTKFGRPEWAQLADYEHHPHVILFRLFHLLFLIHLVLSLLYYHRRNMIDYVS